MVVRDKSGFVLARNSHWEVRVSMPPVVCISKHICALKYSRIFTIPVTLQGFHHLCYQLVSTGCMKALRLFVQYLGLTGTLFSICDTEKLASGCENKNMYLSIMTWDIPVYPDLEVKSSSNVQCYTMYLSDKPTLGSGLTTTETQELEKNCICFRTQQPDGITES